MVLFCLTTLGYSQSIGIRAGLNWSKFDGPLENGESYDYNQGFHFGINYGYRFTNKFMVRAELLYIQIGSKNKYFGDSYYKIYPPNKTTVYEKGNLDLKLDISNAYINIPLVAAYQINSKFEIFGGASVNFLVNPVGRGQLRFESFENADGIVFRQSLDYQYYNDNAQEGRAANTNIAILVDDERVDLPRYAGAYYQYSEVQKTGSLFNWFDASLVGGLNFFFNRGFYTGITLNYGLTDVTNNEMDVSRSALADDNKFIYRDDRDINLSAQISLGFRF